MKSSVLVLMAKLLAAYHPLARVSTRPSASTGPL